MRSFKTKIDPNNAQRTRFLQHAGTARHAWNWGLGLCKTSIYKAENTPSAIDLHKLLVRDVKSVNEWYYNCSKCAPQQALRNLCEALQRFWKQHKINKTLPLNKRYLKKYIIKYGKGEIDALRFEHEKGFPKFKRRGEHDNFYLESPNFQFQKNKIKIPKIGWIKTYETLPEGVKPKSVVISRQADEWFISFAVDPKPEPISYPNRTKIGVDLGVKTLATLSNGMTFANPKAYQKQRKKLRRLQRSLCRKREAQKKSGLKSVSKNYVKNAAKLAKVHQRIGNIRKDTIHKLTTHIVKNHNVIVVEDLNVSGMAKNHNLASAILDGGFYEFRRQLEYKSKWTSAELQIADRFYPSSQLCSCCGHRQKMPLKKRIYVCGSCEKVIDRDLNAAINLENYTPSFGVKVCGDTKFQGASPVGVGEAEIRPQACNVQVCVSS